jgi:hypothetical protein
MHLAATLERRIRNGPQLRASSKRDTKEVVTSKKRPVGHRGDAGWDLDLAES